MTDGTLPTKLAPRFQRLAPGHPVNPYRVARNERIGDRIRTLQQDKLIARARPVEFWQPVLGGATGTSRCSCVSPPEPDGRADRQCLQCYGTGWTPGYLRLGCDTLWALASQHATGAEVWALADLEVATAVLPWRLQLSGVALSGTAITPARPFTALGSQAGVGAWVSHLDASTRDGGTVGVEYSLDDGASWADVDNITDDPPTGTGTLRFRITITRASTDVVGPAFDGVRLRRVATNRANPHILVSRPDFAAGQVLLHRPPVNQQNLTDAYMGHTAQHLSDRGWTAPLDFFDLGVGRNTPQARIADDQHGPHAFYAISDDAWATTRRYAMVNVVYSTEVGLNQLTAQSWEDRLVQPSESAYLVW